MTPFWTQFAISLTAIGLMIGLAAWAKIARPLTPLSTDQARALIGLDFPTRPLGPVWIEDQGQGAIIRSGDLALILFRFGDSYVSRAVSWDRLNTLSPSGGQVLVPLDEFEAPKAHFAVSGAWPPSVLQGAA